MSRNITIMNIHRRHARIFHILLLVPLLLLVMPGRGDVRMSGIFGNGMVLQREAPIRVWGWALPGEPVTVSLSDQRATVITGADWGWSVQLPAVATGGPYTLTVQGYNTMTFTDVLVGEVWVCSGQSNMEWPVQQSVSGDIEVATAIFPRIRLYTVPKSIALEPQYESAGVWMPCTPQTVKDFSAIGFFFARQLHAELKIPIGIINSSWGGTVAEGWTDRETLNTHQEFRPIIEGLNLQLADFARNFYEVYHLQLRNWLASADASAAAGAPFPLPPVLYVNNDPRLSGTTPTVLFNAMISPLTRMNIAGVLWYQGESHGGFADQYRLLFPAMINGWRRAWQKPLLPFLFVQLPNFNAAGDPDGISWAEVREAQKAALALPNTAMTVTIDLGEAEEIHPRNKQGVSYRLALNALGIVYGRDIVYSGPLYENMTIEGQRIRLTFSHTGSGLVVGDQRALLGFTIAGADGNYLPATAVIEGNTVVVSSPQVPAPVAVRYAWANNPTCNLYNKEGLPASPFRTNGNR